MPIAVLCGDDGVIFQPPGLNFPSGTVVTGPTISGGTQTLTTQSGNINTDTKVLVAAATYTSNATPALVTGWAWTVVAGATYVFEVNMPTVMTTVGGLTFAFHLTTATLTSIQYQTYAATATDNSTAVSTTGTTTTNDTKLFDSKTAAYTGVRAYGSFVVNAGGTFSWYASQNTSAAGGDATSLSIGAYARMIRAL